ncbi:MAG: DMT family transporter [Planctomycetota bacterium]
MSRVEHIKRGAFLMVLASGFFCIAGCLIKCGSYMGAYKLAFFRFVIGLGMIATVAMSGRAKLAFVNKKLLFLRGLTGGTAVCIALLSITKLGLGKGMVLICSYPIFAALTGAVFLKERLRLLDIGAILTAILGIYFIAYERQQGFWHVACHGAGLQYPGRYRLERRFYPAGSRRQRYYRAVVDDRGLQVCAGQDRFVVANARTDPVLYGRCRDVRRGFGLALRVRFGVGCRLLRGGSRPQEPECLTGRPNL